jgi:hypothetical protein
MKEIVMYPLTKVTAASILVALAAATSPAQAGELPQNLGPVGPHEPILTNVGHKRVLAWYQPDSVGCAVNAVVWNRADVEGTSTAGLRIRLDRGQIVHFDSAYNVKSLNLKCADDASTLSIVDNEESVAFGIQRADPPMD